MINKVDKIIVAFKNEFIDHYSGLTTCLDFLESLRHHERIAAHRVLVQATSATGIAFLPTGLFNAFSRQSLYETGCWLAVRNHNNLFHLFALGLEKTAR